MEAEAEANVKSMKETLSSFIESLAYLCVRDRGVFPTLDENAQISWGEQKEQLDRYLIILEAEEIKPRSVGHETCGLLSV